MTTFTVYQTTPSFTPCINETTHHGMLFEMEESKYPLVDGFLNMVRKYGIGNYSDRRAFLEAVNTCLKQQENHIQRGITNLRPLNSSYSDPSDFNECIAHLVAYYLFNHRLVIYSVNPDGYTHIDATSLPFISQEQKDPLLWHFTSNQENYDYIKLPYLVMLKHQYQQYQLVSYPPPTLDYYSYLVVTTTEHPSVPPFRLAPGECRDHGIVARILDNGVCTVFDGKKNFTELSTSEQIRRFLNTRAEHIVTIPGMCWTERIAGQTHIIRNNNNNPLPCRRYTNNLAIFSTDSSVYDLHYQIVVVPGDIISIDTVPQPQKIYSAYVVLSCDTRAKEIKIAPFDPIHRKRPIIPIPFPITLSWSSISFIKHVNSNRDFTHISLVCFISGETTLDQVEQDETKNKRFVAKSSMNLQLPKNDCSIVYVPAQIVDPISFPRSHYSQVIEQVLGLEEEEVEPPRTPRLSSSCLISPPPSASKRSRKEEEEEEDSNKIRKLDGDFFLTLSPLPRDPPYKPYLMPLSQESTPFKLDTFSQSSDIVPVPFDLTM